MILLLLLFLETSSGPDTAAVGGTVTEKDRIR